ncbi:hypothetical protein CALCODRAFT_553992 [Calocera cornea HHB12733]|uniref:Transcription factor IIIC 90kDa subunit N-terminal domain-containing protein n=1 Tax=Calocera cornea HHB12733 TaxID=1353952 RepID=A0A165HWV6_9BASI|nr:hypothetical protein CALCODRAFT_553992 [Calocera cornea HHB12733]
MAVKEPDIHIAVELPSTPQQSLVTAIQQNADGQIGVIATAGIHILTPAVGIEYDLASAEPGIVPALQKASREPLKLFRAVADMLSGENMLWVNETLEPAAMALGSIQIRCKDFAWSPSGVSSAGTCLLAILTTNLEVFIYAPGKNYMTGEWTRTASLTPALLASTSAVTATGSLENAPMRRVLQAQTTALSWSGPVRAPTVPSSRDLSLLALGNRAGSVSLWRHGSADVWRRHASVVVGEEWVTQVSWAGWLQIDAQTVASSLACGLSDGSIRLVTVLQKISPGAVGEAQAFLTPTWGTSADSRSLTSLKWIDLQAYPRYVLAYSKPGVFGLISPVGSGLGWTGERRLLLSKQPIHACSSALGTPSDFHYFAVDDALLVTYSDGTVQVVHQLSTDPTLEMPGSPLKPLDITRAMRRVFLQIEGPDTTDVTVMQTVGCCFVSDAVALWSYHTVYPTFLDYHPELSQFTTLTMAALLDLNHDPALALQNIEQLCASDGTQALGLRPRVAQKLISIYLDLEANHGSDALRAGLSRIVEVSVPQWTDAARNRVIPGWRVPDTQENLREQLHVDLIDGADVTLLRCKLATLQLADKFGYSFPDRISLVQSLIIAHIFGVYLYAAADPRSLVTTQDIAFARRIVKISNYLPVSIETTKPLTVGLAKSLNVDLDVTVPAPDEEHKSSATLTSSFDVGDVCVVCKGFIPMTNLERASCEAGHVWERCSITTLPLATPNVRTCVGCSRKAHLPPSEIAEKHRVAHGWFADLVLESVRSCLYCGNHFVRIL